MNLQQQLMMTYHSKASLLLCIALLTWAPLSAQYLNGVATKWSDSFMEWTLFSEDGEEGDLAIRWRLQEDWTEWDYRLEEATGRIKMKWKGNPNEWELRGDNEIIHCRTVWNNNFNEWRIRGNGTQLTFRSRYGNMLEEWELKGDEKGSFYVYTAWEGDPREWVIEDNLAEEIGFPMKMAMIFLVLYHSTPKQ